LGQLRMKDPNAPKTQEKIGSTSVGSRSRLWPLQADFALVAVVVVLAGLVAGGLIHFRSDSDARRSADADAGLAATKAAQQIESTKSSIDQLTTPIAQSPANLQIFQLGTCNVAYGPIGDFGTGHIDILRSDGSVICSSLTGGTKASYSGAPWLQASGETVTAPVLDAITGHQVAIYSYSIGGQGAIAWFFDLEPLAARLGSDFASGNHKLEFLVVSRDGSAVVARSPDSRNWTGVKIANTSFRPAAGPFDAADVDGLERWYSSAKVRGTGWTVYVGADKAAALAGATGPQAEELAVVGGGVLAVLLALFFVYRRVARPIAALSKAVRSSSGSESPTSVKVSGPAQVVSLGEDINHLINSWQHELEERVSAQHNYRQLFEGSPNPIVFVDTESGRFLEVNQAAADAFGYPREEFPNLNASDFQAPQTEQEIRDLQTLRTSIQDGKGSVRFGPFTVKRKDGTLRRVLVTSYGVLYGTTPARVSMNEDVTERERLERQQIQNQRLESLGQLAGGVAHDFNNLLGAILNFSLFAKEKIAVVAGTADASARENLQAAAKDIDRVVHAGESASHLTHQLLAFARREVLRPQALDVSSVVTQLEPLLRRTLGEHIEFTTSLAPGAWHALMDPGQLEQVLTNLAINARDAMPNGGKLVIEADNLDADEAYVAGRQDLKPGRYLRLRVSDTGTGMDANTLQHVFEPFFTTKAKGHGTGLGLATVYGIIQQSGGYISIYSETGHGTRVTVLLPATDSLSHDSRSTELLTLPPMSATVLLVEDAADLREVAERILIKNGFRVLSAADGIAAIDAAHQHDGKIDLLLTDVVMPKMQGKELAEVISSTRPGIRVLFMSGYAEPMLGDTGALDPGILLLEKPFTEPTLLAKVHEALDGRNGVRANKAVAL
jgi:PAS domain S-box-containing protein